jgi:two-component system cell cycle sensor histidine kinase PleC
MSPRQKATWSSRPTAARCARCCTTEGGVVTARAQGDGAGVTIGIADQGPGIAEADLERVLQPFEVVRSDAHTAKSGAGLGLPLSRMLAELHGGALTIRAAPDEGTTVIVRLPRKAVAD